jgi:hypothetical protein
MRFVILISFLAVTAGALAAGEIVEMKSFRATPYDVYFAAIYEVATDTLAEIRVTEKGRPFERNRRQARSRAQEKRSRESEPGGRLGRASHLHRPPRSLAEGLVDYHGLRAAKAKRADQVARASVGSAPCHGSSVTVGKSKPRLVSPFGPR